MLKVLVIALVASFGGLAVFIGLLLEEAGEKEMFENIDEYRRSKAKAHRGIKWVTWGVFAEVVLAFGVAIWEGGGMLLLEHQVEMGSADNKNIESLNAEARFITSGTNFNFLGLGFSEIKPDSSGNLDVAGEFMSTHLLIRDSLNTNIIPIAADKISIRNLGDMGCLVRISFGRSIEPFHSTTLKAKNVDDWVEVSVVAGFPGNNQNINNGELIITANSWKSRRYEFPPQNAGMMGELTANEGHSFFTTKTNGR